MILLAFRCAVARCSALPDPAADAGPWMALLKSNAEWLEAFGCFKYCEPSVGEALSITTAVTSLAAPGEYQAPRESTHAGYTCDVCNRGYSNAKAALAHQRAKHGHRVEQRFYSNSVGLWQVCGTIFHTHARLLRHLTDKRRTKCWTAIRNGPNNYTRLSESQVEELDIWYREQKTLAWKAGHSHVLSIKPARTNVGKMVGHVQR